MKKSKFKLPIKLIAIIIIIFLAIGAIIGYIWKFLKTTDYFKIKDIITRVDSKVDLSYLKGKNIFSVDLKNESRYILEYYPDCSKIRLVRLLPDRIFVDFIKRKPIGFVKLYRYFAVDEEGVLFYSLLQPQDLELPIILGLETKIFGPKSGRLYNVKELMLALNIIKEAKRNRVFKNYKIKKIDVTSTANTSIFLSFSSSVSDYPKGQPVSKWVDLEVKLGENKIEDKIAILGGLIIQEKFDLANIKYIDLRFKEPLIKLKDAK